MREEGRSSSVRKYMQLYDEYLLVAKKCEIGFGTKCWHPSAI